MKWSWERAETNSGLGVRYEAAHSKARMEHNQSTSYTHAVVHHYSPCAIYKAAAAENESGKGVREIMTENMRELSIGEMCDIRECDATKLRTTVPYV